VARPRISFESRPPLKVVSLECTGPYEELGFNFIQLKGWLDKARVRVEGRPIGLFYDNPKETPREALRSEACLPVLSFVRSQGRFKMKELPGGTVAVTKYEEVPGDYTEIYGPYLEELLSSGYRLIGPAREIFRNISPELRPGMGIQIEQLISRAD
jgi:DNA gyrase inhibitor GyrI